MSSQVAALLATARWFGAAAHAAGAKAVACGNPSGQQTSCPTEVHATGVRIGREISRQVCRQGYNWGYTDSFIWTNRGCQALFAVSFDEPAPAPPTSRVVTCGSNSSPMRCRTGGFVSDVDWLRDLGRSRCREGHSWWYDSDAIVTQAGCRAEFEVDYQNTMPPPTTRQIECGNPLGGPHECSAEGPVASARVASQRGLVRCREGGNWGHTRTSIWTNQGCYAMFEVTYAERPLRPPPAGTRVVQCGNRAGSAMGCNAFGPVAEVRVLREYSHGRCRLGHGWGKQPNDIWVKNGCFADFEITYLAPQPR